MGKRQYNKEIPVSRTGKKEFPSGEKGVVLCPGCHSVYRRKFWHRDNKDNQKSQALSLLASRGLNKNKKFILCPACQMIKNKEFEGKLTISDFSPVLEADLNRLIKNFCQRAFERDPLHRLIGIKNDSGILTVTTTENQLAVKLAKKIKEVFGKNKIQIKISYSPEPGDAVYIKINFVKQTV